MDAAGGRHRAMLCGSIGLIAAVPLTTLLAAALVGRGAEASQSPPPSGARLVARPMRCGAGSPRNRSRWCSTPCSACMRRGCRMPPSG